MKVKGFFALTHKDKDGNILYRYGNNNTVVNSAFNDLFKDALTVGAGNKPIYRVGWGSGGYDGVERKTPNKTWYTLTDMYTPIGSQDISTQTVSFHSESGHLIVANSTTFAASDYGLVGVNVNEISLIAGTGSSGIRLGSTHMGSSDILFSYHTFDQREMNPGDTLDINWEIHLIRG